MQDISQRFLTNHLMTAQIYEKYLRFHGKREVNRNPDLKWCPTVDCEGYLKKPLIDLNVTCSICKKTICFGCLQTPHDGATCDDKLEKEYGVWAGQKTEVGKCKSCAMRIEKNGGCPNMTC